MSGDIRPEIRSIIERRDFFVYLGLAKGKDLVYMTDILLAGPTTHSLNNAITQRFQSTLQTEYRNWAKNQVIEKEIDFDPDGPSGPKSPWLQNPCEIQREVITLPRHSPPKFKHELRYPAEDSLELELGYLTSEVVKIEFFQSGSRARTYQGRIERDGAKPILQSVFEPAERSWDSLSKLAGRSSGCDRASPSRSTMAMGGLCASVEHALRRR